MLALILLLCSNTTKAESLLERIHNPPSNGTLVEEIQCYAIPNGGIGFASHIITYCEYIFSNFKILLSRILEWCFETTSWP